MSKVSEKPILFNGEMVRAILSGKKTQTRRVVKLKPGQEVEHGEVFSASDPFRIVRPYGRPGDRLWVRETFRTLTDDFGFSSVQFAADEAVHRILATDEGDGEAVGLSDRTTVSQWAPTELPKWTPSIHMPRWASRLTLEITAIRVERLQDISAADAAAEGIESQWSSTFNDRVFKVHGRGQFGWTLSARHSFETLWQSVYGKKAGHDWQSNPWVWVVEFKKVTTA